jgi:hypothetical protein
VNANHGLLLAAVVALGLYTGVAAAEGDAATGAAGLEALLRALVDALGAPLDGLVPDGLPLGDA